MAHPEGLSAEEASSAAAQIINDAMRAPLPPLSWRKVLRLPEGKELMATPYTAAALHRLGRVDSAVVVLAVAVAVGLVVHAAGG
jgi:hypothetical protein